jgi:hypothetical protein
MLNSWILILKVFGSYCPAFLETELIYLLRKRGRCKHWGILMGPARQLGNEEEKTDYDDDIL